jgi:hypothetical protein
MEEANEMRIERAPARGGRRGLPQVGRRLRRFFPAAVLPALCLVAASPAFGAKPKGPACWGPTPRGCVSEAGPIGGNISVSGGIQDVIYRFADSEKCLGISNGLQNEVLIATTIPIAKSGAFSFKGKAMLVVVPPRAIPVVLSGRFLTPTLVKLTLTIHYKSCRTAHLTLRYPTA